MAERAPKVLRWARPGALRTARLPRYWSWWYDLLGDRGMFSIVTKIIGVPELEALARHDHPQTIFPLVIPVDLFVEQAVGFPADCKALKAAVVPVHYNRNHPAKFAETNDAWNLDAASARRLGAVSDELEPKTVAVG